MEAHTPKHTGESPGDPSPAGHQGATDAWYKVAVEFEHLKLKGEDFVGCTADIMKFFDQIVREVVCMVGGGELFDFLPFVLLTITSAIERPLSLKTTVGPWHRK